jgi:hypothetical protein
MKLIYPRIYRIVLMIINIFVYFSLILPGTYSFRKITSFSSNRQSELNSLNEFESYTIEKASDNSIKSKLNIKPAYKSKPPVTIVKDEVYSKNLENLERVLGQHKTNLFIKEKL